MIKRFLSLLTVIMLLSYQSGCETNSKPIQISSDEIEVFFSPQGGCTEAIVKTLDQAKSSVLIQAYSFTSSPIAKAVVEAHKRGVQTEVILDKSQRSEKYSSADFFAHAGKCSN